MMKFHIKNQGHKTQSGATLVELLFYIGIFTVMAIVVINAMVVMTKSFRQTSIQAQFIQSGEMMERMVREIRQAYDITFINVTATDLRLATKDIFGVNKTVEFLLSGTDLQLIENGTITGTLNASNINVTSLSFTQINTAKGKAVKVSLSSITSDNDPVSNAFSYYDTVVLRGIY